MCLGGSPKSLFSVSTQLWATLLCSPNQAAQGRQTCFLPTIHTHTTTQTSACTYIHPFHAHAHTHCICNSLHTSTSTHTLLLHYPHPPYPHSHTPSHTYTQTHKLTHTSCTPPYSKMLMTTLSTPLSLISRSVLPTCPSCTCHHSLLGSLSSASLITFLLWRL